MTVDRLIRHFRAREYMELCREKEHVPNQKHAAQIKYTFKFHFDTMIVLILRVK